MRIPVGTESGILTQDELRSMRASKKITKLPFTEIHPYVESLLKNIVAGKHVLQLQKDTPVFTQGDRADAIYFIQTGKVKITVVSAQGKEAVLAMLGPREFFGEGSMVGQPLRMSTATTTESSTVFRVQKQAMLQALHAQPDLSEKFTAALLARNISLEEDLCDQLFNHSEKRLARVLLKLSRFGQGADVPDAKMPKLTHETLAEMVGTTRSRITHFMNKFRTMGLIEYTGKGDITVRAELMTDVVLHD
jgi:CRP/FNR family cyclic AMP-dependent transcriptional regulator